jgi:hypothetical protein
MPVKIEFGDLANGELGNSKRTNRKTIARFSLMDVPDLALQGFRASHELLQTPTIQPPELVGRITVDTRRSEGEGEENNDEGLVVDDEPYVKVMEEANWKMREECLEYLRTA